MHFANVTVPPDIGLVYVIDEIRGSLGQDAQLVRDKSELRAVNHEYVEITTTYRDRHGDTTSRASNDHHDGPRRLHG